MRQRKRTGNTDAINPAANDAPTTVTPLNHSQNHDKETLSVPALIPREDRRPALSIFLAALALYLSNGSAIPSNDVAANLFFPIQLFKGKLTFMPSDVPALYFWAKKKSGERINLGVTMKSIVRDTPLTGRDFMALKDLSLTGAKYMLSRTIRGNMECVNTFNFGTGITFVPLVAVLALCYPNLDALQANSWLLAYAGKVLASVLVAASASFVYLSANIFPSVQRSDAMLIAVAYAFGTCTWSVSSQALWQHGPNEFYLSVAIWALVKAQRRHEEVGEWSTSLGVLCGFAASMATISRPTSAVIAAVIGAYFLIAKRSIKMSVAYGSVGAIFGAVQLYYNYTYFGNPFEFGQQMASRAIAKYKTGSEALWQTPLHVGASTLLVSPSRGLFVFSPFTAFAIPAFFLVWKSTYTGKMGCSLKENIHDSSRGNNEFEVVRPLCVSVLFLWLVAFKFFDHWGGYCYGYRPIVDTMPMVMMMLCITIGHIQRSKHLRRMFFVAVVWSVFIQVLGAFTYDSTWNYRVGVKLHAEGQPVDWAVLRPGEKVPRDVRKLRIFLDLDRPEYRSRLWKIHDSQIVYSITNFKKCMQNKRVIFDEWASYFG